MRTLLAFLLCLPMAANDKVDHFLDGAVIGATVTIGFRWSGDALATTLGAVAGSYLVYKVWK